MSISCQHSSIRDISTFKGIFDKIEFLNEEHTMNVALTQKFSYRKWILSMQFKDVKISDFSSSDAQFLAHFDNKNTDLIEARIIGEFTYQKMI